MPIESMVLVKSRVFRRNNRVLQIGRDLAERNESVARVIRGSVYPSLQAALDMHCGRRRVDPSRGHKC